MQKAPKMVGGPSAQHNASSSARRPVTLGDIVVNGRAGKIVKGCIDHCMEYRLADIFSGRMQKDATVAANLTSVICAGWPESIGCNILRQRKARDLKTLLSLVDGHRTRAAIKSPPTDTLVVHLRLGDVLDWPFYVHVRKCTAEVGCYYVHPISFYETLPIPPTLRRVQLLGDPRYRYRSDVGSRRSVEYRARVADVFTRRHGLATTIRAPASADDDLAYMAQATHLVPSRGGYGALAHEVALHRNGSVFWHGMWRNAE